jgi:hypothetical protein
VYKRQLQRSIKKGSYDVDLLRTNGVSESGIAFLQQIVQVGEENRPSCAELLSSDYFSEELAKIRQKGMDLVSRDMLENLREFSITS